MKGCFFIKDFVLITLTSNTIIEIIKKKDNAKQKILNLAIFIAVQNFKGILHCTVFSKKQFTALCRKFLLQKIKKLISFKNDIIYSLNLEI